MPRCAGPISARRRPDAVDLQKDPDARERARDVTLVIGGAYGLSDALRQQAERRLSLAPWTLPHELARLVLAEQLYRAGTIVRREPYHK